MKDNAQEPLQSIPYISDIEIKNGIMYLTACIKQHKERAKRTAFSLQIIEQSEQKFEDKQKADEQWQLEKRTHNRRPALELLVISQWVGLGLNSFHSCASASPTCLQAMSWHDYTVHLQS